ncbi:MAG: TetR/AcrR family transcriptional regulator [Candidatus Binatia bacterium]|nr:TetR/AcrR family transcriptional regulator [Candidatus Binatia bacterium]
MTRSPRERAREARLAVYRQHILEAAEQVFAERGFSAASMQEIGRRAALSMGTIYSVFRSKEEVLQALLEARGGEILELVRRAAAREGSATTAFFELLRDYVLYFSERPHFLRMHLRLGAAWMHSPENGTGKRAAVWAEIQRLQASIFARGIAEGIFVEAPPLLLARLFSAVNQTLLANWVEGGMRSDPQHLLEEVEQWIKRLLWR